MSTTTPTNQIQETLQSVYEKYKDLRDGEVATYIPELARAKPDEFGIILATVDGQVFSVGRFAARVHDPVDLQALRVPDGPGGIRPGCGAREGVR